MAITIKNVPIIMKAKGMNAGRTDVFIEQHTLVIDEPVNRGGTDQGPTPLDTLVASLVGCTNVILNLIAKQLKCQITDMNISVDSSLNVKGILGIEPITTPISEITLSISFATDADADRIARMQRELPLRCAVAVILRQAGISINELWTVNRNTLATYNAFLVK